MRWNAASPTRAARGGAHATRRAGADPARENQKRLVNALRENSELRARLSDSSASVRRTVLLEDIEDSDSLAPVPAPPPRRRRSSSASLFGDEDPISSLRGRSAVPRSPRRRSASGSSFVDEGPSHKTRAPRSAARTPRHPRTTNDHSPHQLRRSARASAHAQAAGGLGLG